MNFSDDVMVLLKNRYLWENETPTDMFFRVASEIAENSSQRKEFFDMMSNLYFLPNTPCLLNAGKKHPQLFACFVLPVEDSLDSIFETVKRAAKIHQSGGGTGFNFSKLRSRGTPISTSKGFSSGAVSFLQVFNSATMAINSGNIRRGANMGVLNVNHPEILEFINLKTHTELEGFNLSIGMSDDFMKKVISNDPSETIALICPLKGEVGEISAVELFDALVDAAYICGCPGILFLDTINNKYPLTNVQIQCCNPCGEMPLEEWENCCLVSLNLSKIITTARNIDKDLFSQMISSATNFADNMIDANFYLYEENKKKSLLNRKIGVGIMGFQEMLVKMGIRYSSPEALKVAENVGELLRKYTRKTSEQLFFQKGGVHNLERRNLTHNTIAPTGTIARIAMTSHSIEPVFGKTTVSRIANMQFKENFQDSLYETSHEILPKHHIDIQAAFQKYIDNSVSKTINMPFNVSKQEIKTAFIHAWETGCKGITVYRDGSKNQPITCSDTSCTL